jgi:hypothetical protein
MCGRWRIAWILGLASCGGSSDRPPDGAPIDTLPDVTIDVPTDDGPPPPVACPPMMAPRIATASVPNGIAIGDVDGNGTRDLIVTAPPALEVRRGNGDGTFQPPVSVLIPAGAVAPAIADIDGDGDQDIVVALPGASTSAVQIVLGDGAGGFLLAASLPGSYTTSVAIGDLDRDGKLDIVTASMGVSSGLAIHMGTGGGAFAPPVALDAASSYDSVVIADVDGDQLLDLVAPGGMPGTYGELAVFAGNGDGSFEAPFRAPTASDYGTRAAVGDLDGDGVADIVTAGWVATDEALRVESWLGSGTTFTRRSSLARWPDVKSDYPPPNEFRGFRGVPALGDVDGDGLLDVVVTFQNRDVIGFIRGTGTGELATFTEFAMNEQGDNETEGPVDIALADVSGDGRLDAIVPGSARRIEVVLGSAVSTFRAPRGLPSNLAGEGFPWKLALGDLDGDGQQDFVMGTIRYDNDPFMGSVFVVRASVPGFYPLPADPDVGNPENDQLRLRDLDGDRDLDLVVASDRATQGWLSVYRNAGDGTFGPRVDHASGLARELAIGDLDGDSRPELVLAAIDASTWSTGTTIYTNDGAGAFTVQPPFATQVRVALADLDHDTRLDLVEWGSRNAVTVRLGTGTGTFGSPIDTAMTGVVQHVAVADIDGDGTLDLGADTLALIGHGDGTFAIGDALPAAPGGLLALADLDRTPPLDVVGTLGAIYRAGTATQEDTWTITASELRDVTGDGHPDAIGIMRRANTAFVLSSQCP